MCTVILQLQVLLSKKVAHSIVASGSKVLYAKPRDNSTLGNGKESCAQTTAFWLSKIDQNEQFFAAELFVVALEILK